jgi:hypothetical protein
MGFIPSDKKNMCGTNLDEIHLAHLILFFI